MDGALASNDSIYQILNLKAKCIKEIKETLKMNNLSKKKFWTVRENDS